MSIGNLHARRQPLTYRDVDDQVQTVDRQVLHQRILEALASGPLHRWELRAALHVDEDLIARELTELRKQGRVKYVGKQQLTRKWALASWQSPVHPKGQAPDYPDALTTTRATKPEPAKASWWVGATREDFQKRARGE